MKLCTLASGYGGVLYKGLMVPLTAARKARGKREAKTVV